MKKLVVVLAVLVVLAIVPVHDAVCYVTFSSGSLCQREDGSLWRDPSNGCTGGEDPQCRESRCPDSTMLSEPARRSCSWLLVKREVPAWGDSPLYTGESPGSGILIL